MVILITAICVSLLTQTRNLRTFGKELYLDICFFNNSHLCQFIEIVHKIINWYIKNAK